MALSLGYPFLESAKSIAPLCGEVVINVGFEDPECTQDDGTYEFLRDNLTESKYKFIKSWWDPKICSGGQILAQQTNIALQHCKGKTCQYIQGDETLHEKTLKTLKRDIKNWRIEMTYLDSFLITSTSMETLTPLSTRAPFTAEK